MFDKLKITHTDGSVIEANGRKKDLVLFERQFKMPVGKIYNKEEGLYMEHLYFFGWCAEQRVNDQCPDFDEWLDTVEEVFVVTAEDEVTPTDPSPSPSA